MARANQPLEPPKPGPGVHPSMPGKTGKSGTDETYFVRFPTQGKTVHRLPCSTTVLVVSGWNHPFFVPVSEHIPWGCPTLPPQRPEAGCRGPMETVSYDTSSSQSRHLKTHSFLCQRNVHKRKHQNRTLQTILHVQFIEATTHFANLPFPMAKAPALPAIREIRVFDITTRPQDDSSRRRVHTSGPNPSPCVSGHENLRR